MLNFKEELTNIRGFAFDVDGVFSTSKLLLQTDGDLIRSMNIRDGYSIVHAIKQGFIIGIITGGRSEAVKNRFLDLGVQDVYLGSYDKIVDFKDFIFKNGLDREHVLYMGDDLPDYEVMSYCGVPTCPADAAEEIKSISKYISGFNGGEGCVRDVVEQVLRSQGKWINTGQ